LPSPDPSAANPYAAPALHPEASAAPPSGKYAFTKNPRRLTNLLTFFLGVYLLTLVIWIGTEVSQYAMLGRSYASDEALANDARNSLARWVNFCTFFATAIVFIMWIYRAAVNSRGFGAEGMGDTPGWHVAWYFIPIANLFRPYQAMKQLWKISGNPGDWKNQESSGLIVVWWTLWLFFYNGPRLIRLIFGNATTPAEMKTTTLGYLVIPIVSAAFAIASIVLVRTLTRRQEELVARSKE